MFVCYVNVDLLRRVMHGKSDTFVDKMGFKCEMGERKKENSSAVRQFAGVRFFRQ